MDWRAKKTWSYDGDWETKGFERRRWKRIKKGYCKEIGGTSYYWLDIRENYWKDERVGNQR